MDGQPRPARYITLIAARRSNCPKLLKPEKSTREHYGTPCHSQEYNTVVNAIDGEAHSAPHRYTPLQ
jgi:hypothetical protein